MSKETARSESDMEDVAPARVLQPIDNLQKQGQVMSREIADSDAEDDAMDVDEGKLMRAPTVTLATKEAPLQFEEDWSSSLVDPPAAPVSSSALEASLDLEMENSNLVDKSLEQSESNTNQLHEDANPRPEPAVIQIGTTESLSMADDENKANAAGSMESFEQMNGTEPKPSLFNAERPKFLKQLTEESRSDNRPEPQAAEAGSFHNATTPESCGSPINLNQAQDIVAEVLEDANSLGEGSSALTTAQSKESVLAGSDTRIFDVPNDHMRRPISPDLPSTEVSTINSLTSAVDYIPEARREVRNGAHMAAQNQNEVEASPASSSSNTSFDTHISIEIKQPEGVNLEGLQAERTPEQKRMANLQSRNNTLTQTLMSLSQQRTALLHSISNHLSPYILADVPSVLKPYRGKPLYTPSTAAHTTPLPAPITPEDDAKLMAEAQQAIKDHIGRLHRYNEIRDVGQGLIGMIADQRGKRIVDCMDEFGVEVGD